MGLAGCLIQVIDNECPANAVCCKVLNLPKAGGPPPRNAALAQAYRVISVEIRAHLENVGSKRGSNIANIAGLGSYTIIKGAVIEKD
jgi:hypothetical protein